MLEYADKYLEIAQQIEVEGRKNGALGSDANYTKMLSLMNQHVALAAVLNVTSPFEDQISHVSDLNRRLNNYRRTGLFEVGS